MTAAEKLAERKPPPLIARPTNQPSPAKGCETAGERSEARRMAAWVWLVCQEETEVSAGLSG
jgi:hypothetical protein